MESFLRLSASAHSLSIPWEVVDFELDTGHCGPSCGGLRRRRRGSAVVTPFKVAARAVTLSELSSAIGRQVAPAVLKTQIS